MTILVICVVVGLATAIGSAIVGARMLRQRRSEPWVAYNDFPSHAPLYEATWDQGRSWWAWDPWTKKVLKPSWVGPEEGRWVFLDGRLCVVTNEKVEPVGGE